MAISAQGKELVRAAFPYMGLKGLQSNQSGRGNRHRGLRHLGLEARRARRRRDGFRRAEGCARASTFSKTRMREPCSGSKAATRRSRKRRRSEAGPAKSRSCAGVSQRRRMYSPRAPGALLHLAVDHHEAAAPIARLGLAAPAGAERRRGHAGCRSRRRWPSFQAALPGQILEGSTAQATAGRQERDRFENVGLACAIGAGQRHEPRSADSRRPAIVAEVRERQPGDGKRGGVGHKARLTPAWASAHRGPDRPKGRG